MSRRHRLSLSLGIRCQLLLYQIDHGHRPGNRQGSDVQRLHNHVQRGIVKLDLVHRTPFVLSSATIAEVMQYRGRIMDSTFDAE